MFSASQPWPWWQTSAVVALGATVFVALALYLPVGRATIVLAAGVGVFGWMLVRNPNFWIRRMASACASAAVVIASIPMFSGALELDSLGSVVIRTGGTEWLTPIFLIAAVILAVLDVWREQPASNTAKAAPASGNTVPSTSQKHAGIHFQDVETAEVKTESGDIAGGNITRSAGRDNIGQIFNAPVTINHGAAREPRVTSAVLGYLRASGKVQRMRKMATLIAIASAGIAAWVLLNPETVSVRIFDQGRRYCVKPKTCPNGAVLTGENERGKPGAEVRANGNSCVFWGTPPQHVRLTLTCPDSSHVLEGLIYPPGGFLRRIR